MKTSKKAMVLALVVRCGCSHEKKVSTSAIFAYSLTDKTVVEVGWSCEKCGKYNNINLR